LGKIILTAKATGQKIEFDQNNFDVSDEYHTMHELYKHRMALNIALFNNLHHPRHDSHRIEVMKSKLHHDGTMFDGYFVVMAITPIGQISYHYKLKHWNKFMIPEVDRTPEWDGHNSYDVLERLMEI
jgi:hypothetical protein